MSTPKRSSPVKHPAGNLSESFKRVATMRLKRRCVLPPLSHVNRGYVRHETCIDGLVRTFTCPVSGGVPIMQAMLSNVFDH